MSIPKTIRSVAAAAVLIAGGCGVYTFSGSTLPAHLSTVEIPLFVNESLQPGVAEEITDALSRRVQRDNLLQVVSRGGDARIQGTVRRYTHDPHTYGAAGDREVDVSEYAVTITAFVSFMDTRKDNTIYEGALTATALYDFGEETEEEGRHRAVEDIVDQIIRKSVQGW